MQEPFQVHIFRIKLKVVHNKLETTVCTYNFDMILGNMLLTVVFCYQKQMKKEVENIEVKIPLIFLLKIFIISCRVISYRLSSVISKGIFLYEFS